MSWPQAEQVTEIGTCVYAIWRDETLWYIGYTRNFPKRMYTHHATDTKGFPKDGVTIRYFASDSAPELEPRLIQKYKPIGNRLDTGNICECRCGNIWISRVEKPKACPECKDRRWNKEKEKAS